MFPSFLPYQKRWIQDNSNIKLMEKSRQIGISWATAYSLVYQQFTTPSPSHVWISSRDITQAKLFINDCKNFAAQLNGMTKMYDLSSLPPPPLELFHKMAQNKRGLGPAGPNSVLGRVALEKNAQHAQALFPQVKLRSDLPTELELTTYEDSPPPSSLNLPVGSSSFTLQFAKKNSISALSSSPNAHAGKVGTRILDEFALHLDPKELYAIAYPGITWGGQLQIISTHRGYTNFFNTLIQEILHNGNPKKISHHRVTLQDALDQGFLKTLKATLPPSDPRQAMDEADYFNFVRNSCPDEETFLQEYMCVPADYRSYFLCPNLVASCEYKDTNTDWNLPLHKLRLSPHSLYLGIDVGLVSDLTVLWLIEVVNNIYFTRHVLSLKTTDFNTQEKFLKDFTTLPNLRRICIDQTGMGRQFAERAKITFSPSRVEGVTFTKPLKEILAYTVRSELEKRSLHLPPDARIRADLLSLKRQLTAAGNVRLDADHSSAGHADHFWALALALHAAKSTPPPSAFHIEVISRDREYEPYPFSRQRRPFTRRGFSIL